LELYLSFFFFDKGNGFYVLIRLIGLIFLLPFFILLLIKRYDDLFFSFLSKVDHTRAFSFEDLEKIFLILSLLFFRSNKKKKITSEKRQVSK